MPKIYEVIPNFKPIIIELTTKQEAQALRIALDSALSFFLEEDGEADTDEIEILQTIKDNLDALYFKKPLKTR